MTDEFKKKRLEDLRRNFGALKHQVCNREMTLEPNSRRTS